MSDEGEALGGDDQILTVELGSDMRQRLLMERLGCPVGVAPARAQIPFGTDREDRELEVALTETTRVEPVARQLLDLGPILLAPVLE